jgi:hypothetical protein
MILPSPSMPDPVHGPSLATVDWARVAEPQADAYDTNLIEELATTLARSDEPARPVGKHTGPVWFDVSPAYAERPDFQRDFGGFAPATAAHPSLPLAVALLDTWALGAAQARRLIRVLHPALEPDADHHGWHVAASSSHSYPDAFGAMWATVNSPVGLAEAIVHEMAHHKMRAFGVGFDHAEHLVANRPGERYPSPLLSGRPRPMPALLHAHYALLHMIALELEILATGIAAARPIVAALLRRHIGLIGSGEATLRRNLVVDEYGARFLPALRSWQARLLARAEVHR